MLLFPILTQSKESTILGLACKIFLSLLKIVSTLMSLYYENIFHD
jgi:hypothetical protein